MGASDLSLDSESFPVSGVPRGLALPLPSALRPGAIVESVMSALSLPMPPTLQHPLRPILRVLWGSVVPAWKHM